MTAAPRGFLPQSRSAIEIRGLDDGPGCRLGEGLRTAAVGIEIGVPTVMNLIAPGAGVDRDHQSP
jgi:hypothetical protein